VGDCKDPKNLGEILNFALKGPDATMASRSDIMVDPAIARWNLVQERASEAIAELLLLLFFVILLVVRPLRSFVENIDHETVLPCLAQEDPTSLAAPISTAPTITPTISKIPVIPTALKTPVAVPILTSTLAADKKPSIRPIVSLNPLRVVPVPKPQSTSI
jgi:hypothetical protein